MVAVVVDTNVPMVANGSCEGVSPTCRLAAMDFLEELLHKGELVVDIEGKIEEEYWKNLGIGGPGVGNRFLQKFFSEAANRVVRVSAPLGKDGKSDKITFDGSLKKFDLSDRKFVIVALESQSSIYNATDSDWYDHIEELNKRGVVVEFLCGCDKRDWFQ